MSRSTK
ncbi:hypothetical protein FG05_35419 [Fusarium graminearum]|nr:hypothetical protein FG05_35419 [Fusarium graminearum]